MTGDETRLPEYSVLIARASREDRRRILETLDAIDAQDCDFPFEVLVVDRLADAVTADLARERRGMRLMRSAPDASMPEMRAAALAAARGRIVVVTEDHCVPSRGWLRSFEGAFRRYPKAAVVGGGVANGLVDRTFDWATYLCEYAAFAPPFADGPGHPVPGMNTAYRREVLQSVPNDLLKLGFWETTVHPELVRAGLLLVACEGASVSHRKRFSMRGFLWQRFTYSRYFAGGRFSRRPQRVMAALLSPVLPALLVFRLAKVVRSKSGMTPPALRSLPFLILFFIAWAAGECWGYLAGPGASLQKIE